MSEEHVERRLAAILAADVVGYSRLMETNEERTLSSLRRHRREFFDPTVARHGGRIFKVMGDGFLIEFASVLNAARCAVEIQRGMPERNAGVPEDRHFKFRMGINLGDLIVDGDDFHGDGVNLAVRLQGLAPPGGIACSAAVRNEVGNKLDLDFADQGDKRVKNIAQPVRVYFADWGQPAAANTGQFLFGGVRPDKPSLAVLPFANLSNDPEQEFFSDGITEDIITDMSNVSGLFVLSRNTVFAYKGRAQNLERIAKELGVAYVVEGSVRKAGNRVRINAELIEGATDGHLWAARYDRDLTDIFAVQDDITKAIVEQLKVKLLPEEKKEIEHAPTENVEAYTHYLRGREYYHIASKANHLMAKQNFARAIELDPNYARAYAGIAVCDSRLKSHYGVDIPVRGHPGDHCQGAGDRSQSRRGPCRARASRWQSATAAPRRSRPSSRRWRSIPTTTRPTATTPSFALRKDSSNSPRGTSSARWRSSRRTMFRRSCWSTSFARSVSRRRP